MVIDEIDIDTDLIQSVKEEERLKAELAFLFGKETVDLASQIDIADLNLNEKMTDSISSGVKKLKDLRHDPQAQADYINQMEHGARLLLCMWIMDMDLLGKIQGRPYLSDSG